MSKPTGVVGLVEQGNTRFRTWVDKTHAILKSSDVPDTFNGVQEALLSHKQIEAEITRTFVQQNDLQEIRAGLLTLGQHIEAVDLILSQFQTSMNQLNNAAKDKRQTLEIAKKSLEKLEDAKQREAKAQERLLVSFSSAVSSAFALFGSTSDLNEFPVVIWPFDQLFEYSKLLPSLEESLTKHLTQVQRVEVMLFDSKITDEVFSFISESLKQELARFAQELRTQRKIIGSELDRRSRSPPSVSTFSAPSTSFVPPLTPTSQIGRVEEPHTDLKLLVTGPTGRRSTVGEGGPNREARFSFVERGSLSSAPRSSVSRSHYGRDDDIEKHRAFETLVRSVQETKIAALRNFASAVCNAVPFFGNTRDFPTSMPAIHPISKDPGPPRLLLSDNEKYIICLLGFIQEHGMHTEKIFSAKGVESEQAALDVHIKVSRNGLNVDFSRYRIHSVATALKRCLAAFDPLFPSSLFVSLITIPINTPGSKVPQIKNVLANLPLSNRHCLAKLFHVITSVWGNEHETKMDARGLAHVFAPHLLRRGGDPSNLYQTMTDLKVTETLLTKMIEEAHIIFGEEVSSEATLSDAINFPKWPNERLFAFVESLDAVDANLNETSNILWSEVERAYSKLVSTKVVEYLPHILSNIKSLRADFGVGKSRRRDLCALEVQRRGQQESQERIRLEKLHESETIYAKQKAALEAWLAKAEKLSSPQFKSGASAAELQTLMAEVRAGRAEAAAILVAATESAMDLQLKGKDWEALLNIKQRIDTAVEALSRITIS